MVKSTLEMYRRQSEKYLRDGPSNVDSEESSDPDTIVKVSEMKRLHRRILKLAACIEPEVSSYEEEYHGREKDCRRIQ